MTDSKRVHIVNGVESELINLQDRGFQYGDGLFETIAIFNGHPILLDLHIKRLSLGLERLHFPELDLNNLQASILKYSNQFDQAILKLIITRGTSERGYTPPAQPETTTVISISEYTFGESFSDYIINRLDVCETGLADNPQLAGIKHLNRLEQVLAGYECQQQQYTDCILLDQNGFVIEAVSSNIFVWKNNALFTPALDRCGIQGIMREKIIELANEFKIPVTVNEMTIKDLKSADAVFLTNSVKAIQPVIALQSTDFEPGKWPEHLFKEVMHHVYS